jgi:hypothetical protein
MHPQPGSGSRVRLVNRAEPSTQPLNASSAGETISIMRTDVERLGVPPEIQVPAGHQIDVALPEVGNAMRAEEEAGGAQLHFHDWEPKAIGTDSKPAPRSRSLVRCNGWRAFAVVFVPSILVFAIRGAVASITVPRRRQLPSPWPSV